MRDKAQRCIGWLRSESARQEGDDKSKACNLEHCADELEVLSDVDDKVLLREDLIDQGYEVPKGAIGWQLAHDGPWAKWWILGVRGVKCTAWKTAPLIKGWNGGPQYWPIVSLRSDK